MQLFYHCFPRPRISGQRTDAEQLTKGLAILRGIAEFGLLLTPERADDGHVRKSCRACFTLASRSELIKRTERVVGGKSKNVSHVDLFGKFAIGISQNAARTLGIQPVVYHYRSEMSDSLSEKIQDKIEEIRSLLGVLAYLEASVGDAEKFLTASKLQNRGYLSKRTERALDLVSALPKHVRRELFDIITEIPRSTSWNLIDWLDLFRDHFQTVDGRSELGTLSYYMQNEWRVGRMQFGNREVVGLDDPSHPAIEEVRSMLAMIDRSFFTPEILDECALLATVRNRYFFDHVTEVICPRSVARDVAEMLDHTDPGQFHGIGGPFSSTSIFERKSDGSNQFN